MAISQGNYLKELSNVSLISATTGILEIAKIPVVDSPDWIIPQSLILAMDEYPERIWTYIWQNQDVSVYHLLPKDMTPEKILVIESITDAHRIGLQIQGEVTFHTVRLIDLRDAEPEEIAQYEASHHHSLQDTQPTIDYTSAPTAEQSLPRASLSPVVVIEQNFVFQQVMLEGELCIVPDLDKLSHYLVDLDS